MLEEVMKKWPDCTVEDLVKDLPSKWHVVRLLAINVASLNAACQQEEMNLVVVKELSAVAAEVAVYAERVACEAIVQAEQEQHRIAYHEAGHAVACHALGWTLKKVHIKKKRGSKGTCFATEPAGFPITDPITPEDHEHLLNKMAIYLAGKAAEELLLGACDLPGVLHDMGRAAQTAERLTTITPGQTAAQRRLLRKAERRARSILKPRVRSLYELSRALLEKQEILGAEAQKIIEAGIATAAEPEAESEHF